MPLPEQQTTRQEDYVEIIYSYAAKSATLVFDPTFMSQPHILRLMAAVKDGISASYSQTKPAV